jgi:polygalacturonase
MLNPSSPLFISRKSLALFGLVFALALTIAQAVEPPSAVPSINVKESGAVGDGAADDTAAIQKALDGGKRTVVIPAGTYRITAALILDSGTTIRADERAVIRLGDHAGNNVGVFLLTNRDFTKGNTDITVDGGIWDGNNEHNPRGLKNQMPCYTGVGLNFINVQHLTLRNLTVRNPDAYAIRACHLADFLIENIGFDFSVTRENQDGVHLNGFCERGIIRNLRALSPYATNDDMVALNADDGAATDFTTQQGMESGPIRDITVEHLRGESAFTFVRLLSYRSAIENVTVSDVSGGCRFYAVNMDRWRFPHGGGNIHNVTLRDFTVRKMPDKFSRQAHPGDRPLIHIQSAAQGLRIENFRRNEPDEATASTLVLDNEAQNHLKLEGLTDAQATALSARSPAVTRAMFTDAHTLEMNAAAKIILPSGGFSLLKLDAVMPVVPANAAESSTNSTPHTQGRAAPNSGR